MTESAAQGAPEVSGEMAIRGVLHLERIGLARDAGEQ